MKKTVPLAEFVYVVFTHMPSGRYHTFSRMCVPCIYSNVVIVTVATILCVSSDVFRLAGNYDNFM